MRDGLLDLGESKIQGDVRGFKCELCSREFFVICFDEKVEEEWPCACPWCRRNGLND